MSTLNSLFNRASFGATCKTCLNLAIPRIKLLRNKRELQLKQMRKEISQYIQTGQEAIARIRVEYIIREQNVLAAYEIIELFCEFVLARIPILESQSGPPTECSMFHARAAEAKLHDGIEMVRVLVATAIR